MSSPISSDKRKVSEDNTPQQGNRINKEIEDEKLFKNDKKLKEIKSENIEAPQYEIECCPTSSDSEDSIESKIISWNEVSKKLLETSEENVSDDELSDLFFSDIEENKLSEAEMAEALKHKPRIEEFCLDDSEEDYRSDLTKLIEQGIIDKDEDKDIDKDLYDEYIFSDIDRLENKLEAIKHKAEADAKNILPQILEKQAFIMIYEKSWQRAYKMKMTKNFEESNYRLDVDEIEQNASRIFENIEDRNISQFLKKIYKDKEEKYYEESINNERCKIKAYKKAVMDAYHIAYAKMFLKKFF